MKNFLEKSPIDQKLSPILIFEQHTDPGMMIMIKNNFNQLIGMGYKALLWEYHPDVTLDALIDILKKSSIEMDEVFQWLEIFGLKKEDLLKANCQELLVALKKTPLSESQRQLFSSEITKVLHNEALLELLKLCKLHEIDYYGIDWVGTCRTSNITSEESFRQDAMRESCFAENIARCVETYNGGVICIMGSAHYPVQKRLMQDPLLQSYTIKSFLKSDPKILSGHIERINGWAVNNQADVFDLGVFDYTRKKQSEINEVFLRDLQPVAITEIYPTTVHHFFHAQVFKTNEKEVNQIEKMVLGLR